MKIAFLSPFYPYRGGIAQFSGNLYTALGKENQVKAFNFERQYPGLLFPGTSQYVNKEDRGNAIPSERVLDSINPLSWFRTANHVLHFEPELLLTRFWLPFFGPSLGTVSYLVKRTGITNIAIVDNAIPHEKRVGDMPFTKYFLKQQHGFVALSKAVKDDLQRLRPGAEVLYHPHPVYDHFGEKLGKQLAREQLQIPEGKKVLLFFGFIRKYKGLDVLIEAVGKLPGDYHLLVAGEPYEDFAPYQEMISRLNLEGRVTLLTRYISDEEVPALFSAADACVLPYRTATQSGIMAVCYHFNLPVIVTDAGGLSEFVTPYNTGIVVDEAEAMKIKSAIVEAFTGEKLGEFSANMHIFKEKYSWANLASSIINFHEKLSG